MSGGQLQLGFDLAPPAGDRAMVEIAPARPSPPAAASPAGPPANVDAQCLALIAGNPNQLVPWFLMAAWAYAICDRPIISDAAFDRIAAELAARWETVEHRHKHLIEPGWLAAGTCLLARADYPATVRGAAAHIAMLDLRVALPRD